MTALTTDPRFVRTPPPGGSPSSRALLGLRGTLLLLQWQVRRQAQFLPLMAVVQTALAVSTVLGYGLLIGNVDGEAALFLATGAPTITLIVIGLVMTPQAMVQARTEGSADWLRTLPLPRGAFLAADLTVWTLLALPGLILGTIVGALRYDITYHLAPWVLPVAILISLTAASIGYAFAALLPPMITQLVSQMLVFLLLLFSPVSFPAANLPGWLRTAHEILPIEPMANLMRAGLAGQAFDASARDLITVLAWCAAAVTAAVLALRRRG
ncbi:ABC transporter permease [Leucobacter aridicollis]|uniref:ABC-2 type transport system permease protein n=1 Tax=Leucobacter aridicollis TaxID=283878 RepID=A0A852RDP9_9MICO|nr:ABC transporter permease [Leucobacter aridicollis]MBL3681464.1 ABC transporter permease [Leucobacter aridicollis]NYD27506.1 ABC-2 type transport system permease protein [Leucobacter aridicollis]